MESPILFAIGKCAERNGWEEFRIDPKVETVNLNLASPNAPFGPTRISFPGCAIFIFRWIRRGEVPPPAFPATAYPRAAREAYAFKSEGKYDIFPDMDGLDGDSLFSEHKDYVDVLAAFPTPPSLYTANPWSVLDGIELHYYLITPEHFKPRTFLE